MPIEVTRERNVPANLLVEHCAFCGRRTHHWFEPKDVAVCQGCAETHDEEQVPDKEAWCLSPEGRGTTERSEEDDDRAFLERIGA